jgi:hypothetical protein
MTDRSKSGPEGTQVELTSEELGEISGGMMSNEPDVAREEESSGGGGGEVITAKGTATDGTLEKLSKVTDSYANIMNSVYRSLGT